MGQGVIVACSNNKRLSGKTCCAVTLAHALGNRGKRVLVCDLDIQCNATSLLLPPGTATKNSLYELFRGKAAIDACIYPSRYELVDVLPSIEDVAILEFELLKNAANTMLFFRNSTHDHVRRKYDYIFLDCPPNLGFWTISGLLAADVAISPIRCGAVFSLDGLQRTIRLMREIQQTANPGLRCFRLLINAVDKRTTQGRVTMAQLADKLGEDILLRTTIPASVLLQQAGDFRQSVLRHNSRSPAAKAYRALAQELIDLTQDF